MTMFRSIKIDDTAMNKHREECERKNKEDIDRWIKALEQVATIDGYRSRDWSVFHYHLPLLNASNNFLFLSYS